VAKKVKEKVLFLDIDGVLWVGVVGMGNWRDFKPEAVINLNYIFSKVKDLKIVVSSTWRHNNSLEWLDDHFHDNGFIYEARFIGATPDFFNKPDRARGYEIQAWLDDHSEVDKFVILDDDSDMVHLKDHLVKTYFYDGLTKENAEEVVEKFRGK